MKPSFTKLTAILGGIVIGTLGGLSVTTPAQAHHAAVTATTECSADAWIVDWTVENQHAEEPAVIDRLEASAEAPIDGELVEGAPLTDRLTGRQVIPLEVSSATLTVTATWNNDEQATEFSDVVTVEQDCVSPRGEPTLEVEHTCTGLSVTVFNPEDGDEDQIMLTPSEGDTITVALGPGTSETIDFPAPEDLDTFSVEVSGGVTETIVWDPPADCPEITMNVSEDCAGLMFTVANPADGESTDVAFTPSSGSARTVTIAPGEAVDVAFPADGADFTVTVSNGEYIESFGWQGTNTCEGLPVTGHSSGVWLVSGVAALVLGAALFAALRLGVLRRSGTARRATTW